MTVAIRELSRADLSAGRAIIAATGLFPADMLDEMASPYLAGGSRHLWFVAGDPMTGIAYAEPERITDRAWNQLMIAVHPDAQGQGVGRSLMQRLEDELVARGERLLLVETSGLPEYEDTRTFYRSIGFEEEARIRDFYAAGEDKIVYRRLLDRT